MAVRVDYFRALRKLERQMGLDVTLQQIYIFLDEDERLHIIQVTCEGRGRRGRERERVRESEALKPEEHFQESAIRPLP